MKYIIYLLTIMLFFTACSTKPSPILKDISYGEYEQSSFKDLPSWEDENYDEVFELFLSTCRKKLKEELFKGVCSSVNNTKDKKSFFEDNFTPFIALSKKSLATGYFEPTLKASLRQSFEYKYPVYAVPSDILHVELVKDYKKSLSKPIRGRLYKNKIVPYYSRKEIENGAIKEEPICYVQDKIALFFLHVQGSGRAELTNGDILYLGYADQNGYPYNSIGKYMLKNEMLKKGEVSLQSIRKYLVEHPESMNEVLNANPSYIFFEKRSQGATGSFGIELIKERSVAVDRKNIPLGMPLFINTKDPLTQEEIQKVVFAHDTGGAIKGESRIDIFFGNTHEAKQKAGKMQAELELWMLVPNDYLNKEQK